MACLVFTNTRTYSPFFRRAYGQTLQLGATKISVKPSGENTPEVAIVSAARREGLCRVMARRVTFADKPVASYSETQHLVCAAACLNEGHRCAQQVRQRVGVGSEGLLYRRVRACSLVDSLWDMWSAL